MALTSSRSAPRDDPAAAPPRRRGTAGFVQGFDGLRAIAALMVIVVHTGIASGFTFRHHGVGPYFARGEIGVSVFFLISGFLLYRPFVAAAFEGRPGPRTGSYLKRRALRIFPLYWAALAATYACAGWATVHGISGLLENAFFLQVYSKKWILHGVTQAWTLCIEVTFYLALPLWAAGMRLVRRRLAAPASPAAILRRELAGLAALYAFGLLFRWWVVAEPTGPTQTAREWIFAWTDHFALGMGLAVVSVYVATVGALPRMLRWMSVIGADLLCWVAAAGVYWVVSLHDGLSENPIATEALKSDMLRQLLYGLFAFLLLMPAVFGPPGRGLVRRLLASRLLSLVGLISYGIYLWHQLVIAELQKYVHGWRVLDSPYPQFAGSVLGIAVAVSIVSYLLIERPGIALGHRRLLRQRERAAVR
ncbi:MAG TPA: acyltransferase [Mycobacteriales bacterium]